MALLRCEPQMNEYFTVFKTLIEWYTPNVCGYSESGIIKGYCKASEQSEHIKLFK